MASRDTDSEFDEMAYRRSQRLRGDLTSENEDQDLSETPGTIKRKPRGKNKIESSEIRMMELELEKQRIEAAKEKDKLEHELKVKTIELEMLKLNNNSTTTQLPVKLKLQPYNQTKEDILTYLSEFENLSKQMK